MAKKSAKKLANSNKRTTKEVTGKDADLLKQLDGRTGVRGGRWKGEVEGDSIIGQLLSLSVDTNKFGNEQVSLIIGTDTGAQTVYCNWSLEQGLIQEGVNISDTIGIQFKGKVPTKGKPMGSYAVVRKGGKGKKLHPALETLSTNRASKPKKGKRKR